MSSIPRGNKPPAGTSISAGLRKGRRKVGESAGAEAAPAVAPPAPAATKRATVAATNPVKPATRPRPSGTSRIAVDVPADLAEQFRKRARRRRFTQSQALAAALLLLDKLDQDEYEQLLEEQAE